MKYKNPIIKGFNPDPSICYDGTKFYLVTSTFEFFPGVPIYESSNLVNWELIGHCLTDEIQCDLNGAKSSRGIYAPTIRYYDGMYFMTTTNVSNGGHLIVHTRNPRDKWSKPVFVDQGGIDPSLLFTNKKVYFTSNMVIENKQSIVMCEINPFTGEKYTDTKCICDGTGGKYPEAPHLYKIGDYYYLMIAEGGTEYGHMETIFRSKEPYGPFEQCPHNPILTHRDAMYEPIECTGHADLVEDSAGNWWMVCLAVRTIGNFLHNLGRETFLAPMKWVEGWPLIGDDGRIKLEMEADFIEEILPVSNDFFDNFSGKTIKLPWTYIRNPKMENYVLGGNKISLIGEGIFLNQDITTPTFMGIRQGEFYIQTSVKLDLSVEAFTGGIVAYYNENYYYCLYVQKDDETIKLVLEKQIHDENIISQCICIDNLNDVSLHIESDKEFYYFYARSGKEKIKVGRGAVAGLCTEGTMSMTFTGVLLGIFCTKGKAEFSNFIYKEISL
jgi:xylan 1,4-beta-xylosidase